MKTNIYFGAIKLKYPYISPPEHFLVTQSAIVLFSHKSFFRLPWSISRSFKAPQSFSLPRVFFTYPGAFLSHPKRQKAFLPWELFSLTLERYLVTKSAIELFSLKSFSLLPWSVSQSPKVSKSFSPLRAFLTYLGSSQSFPS